MVECGHGELRALHGCAIKLNIHGARGLPQVAIFRQSDDVFVIPVGEMTALG